MKTKKLDVKTMAATLDPIEVALVLAVTRQRVSAMVRHGELRAVRIGARRMRITRDSLVEYIERRRKRGIAPAVDITAESAGHTV